MNTKEKQLRINYDLCKETQPIGGVTFRDESVIKTGDGYETCLHVMNYPKELDDFWLSRITNIKDTVVMIDISTQDADIVKKNLNRSMKEQNSRYRSATDYTNLIDAETKFAGMKELLDEVSKMDEVPKSVDSRIFLADRSWLQLDEKVSAEKKRLENDGYISFVNLNETKSDWCSMYQPYLKQQESKYSVEGQFLTSTAIAGGYPFHFSSLEDRTGTFYGTTPTAGNVFFDLFYKTATRKSYNALAIGSMGAGKSTILKKIFEDRAIRGDYVRAFDISGEFTKLTETLGGRILKLDGTDGNTLNPLEILKADDRDGLSYARHMAKLNTFYRSLVPDCDQEELTTFSNYINGLYEELGLLPQEGNIITGRLSNEYPIFSDFHAYLERKIEDLSMGTYTDVELAIAQKEAVLVNKIDKVIVYIITTYGDLFNQHTSMDSILDEQIITFDISKLKDMDSNVFDAQIINILSLCWDNCVINGKMMNDLYHKGSISFDDIIHFLIIIDESHRWLNARKLQALDIITVYMREARKYFGGILLASQSIRDYVPENSTAEALDKLKTLFELTQYKFIFQQDSNALPMLGTIFENVLTESQLGRIPILETGSCVLSIASDFNLEFNVYITDEEEYLFDGGV